MLDEARAEGYNKAIAEQDGRYKIHEKYHELNDKDIEDKAYTQGYKEGIAHCERRDNNPIFNWYVKEYLKEEFLHLDSGLLLQEPIKVFADKLRLEGYKQGHIDTLKKLEHSIKNMYKDATSGENGGTADQAGLARALGLIKSEIKKR